MVCTFLCIAVSQKTETLDIIEAGDALFHVRRFLLFPSFRIRLCCCVCFQSRFVEFALLSDNVESIVIDLTELLLLDVIIWIGEHPVLLFYSLSNHCSAYLFVLVFKLSLDITRVTHTRTPCLFTSSDTVFFSFSREREHAQTRVYHKDSIFPTWNRIIV